MARCPHCNMVLSDSESKAAKCTICKGSLASSSNASEPSNSPAQQTSRSESSGSNDSAPSPLGESSSTRANTTRPTLPSRAVALLALLALWCLILLVWFSGGDPSRVPPRLLGAILLAAPLVVTVWPQNNSSNENGDA